MFITFQCCWDKTSHHVHPPRRGDRQARRCQHHSAACTWGQPCATLHSGDQTSPRWRWHHHCTIRQLQGRWNGIIHDLKKKKFQWYFLQCMNDWSFRNMNKLHSYLFKTFVMMQFCSHAYSCWWKNTHTIYSCFVVVFILSGHYWKLAAY